MTHKMIPDDKWADMSTYVCATCRFYVGGAGSDECYIGRCYKRAPTLDGFPAVYSDQAGCGDHKMGKA